MSELSPRRAGRRSRIDASLPPSPVPAGMVGGRYKPLADSEILQIHELVLRLLEELGLSQVTPSLETRAVAAGCQLDGDGRLRFPRAVVEDVIARVRR